MRSWILSEILHEINKPGVSSIPYRPSSSPRWQNCMLKWEDHQWGSVRCHVWFPYNMLRKNNVLLVHVFISGIIYPFVNQHNYWKSPFLMAKPTFLWPFSTANCYTLPEGDIFIPFPSFSLKPQTDGQVLYGEHPSIIQVVSHPCHLFLPLGTRDSVFSQGIGFTENSGYTRKPMGFTCLWYIYIYMYVS